MSNENKQSVLRFDHIGQSFVQAGKTLDILKDVSFDILAGEIVGLVGPSGSGKSTLLHIAGLLEKQKTGAVFLNNKNASNFDENERTLSRRQSIGFVYQYHHLLPEFSAVENIMMPQIVAGVEKKEAEKRGMELLEKVGLEDRFDHRPGELSGGEQQRVAICRALANKPSLLLADEPTGNLDPETGEKLFKIFQDTVREENSAALIVTHNLELAERCDRTLRLKKGEII